MRRGFKSEANALARELRVELNLRPTDRLDSFQLAEHLAIQVVPLSAFRSEASAMVRHFSRVDRYAFSAITVFDGTTRIIVHNDSHSSGRQASNIAHELSHGLLLHPPRPALNGNGCRDWDQEQELEANWLAGALLIPDEAALLTVRRGLSLVEAAEVYGVSEPMMRFRLNVTAAAIRVERSRRYGA